MHGTATALSEALKRAGYSHTENALWLKLCDLYVEDAGRDREMFLRVAQQAVDDMDGQIFKNGGGQAARADKSHHSSAPSEPLPADHRPRVQSGQNGIVRRNPNEQGHPFGAEGPETSCPAQPPNGLDQRYRATNGHIPSVQPVTAPLRGSGDVFSISSKPSKPRNSSPISKLPPKPSIEKGGYIWDNISKRLDKYDIDLSMTAIAGEIEASKNYQTAIKLRHRGRILAALSSAVPSTQKHLPYEKALTPSEIGTILDKEEAMRDAA